MNGLSCVLHGPLPCKLISQSSDKFLDARRSRSRARQRCPRIKHHPTCINNDKNDQQAACQSTARRQTLPSLLSPGQDDWRKCHCINNVHHQLLQNSVKHWPTIACDSISRVDPARPVLLQASTAITGNASIKPLLTNLPVVARADSTLVYPRDFNARCQIQVFGNNAAVNGIVSASINCSATDNTAVFM